MCPPTHYSHTTRPRPLPASLSPISLHRQVFPTRSRNPNSNPFLWVCLFGVGLLRQCGACHASLVSRRDEEG